MRTLHYLLFALLVAFSGQLQGQAVFCVRAGATGASNGSDWNNAFTSLPGTLQRGATYYIADGSYSGYTFDDPESGSTPITVKKATLTSHGPENGWSSSYGDGQAAFSGDFIMQRDYYIIDGQTRNEGQWNHDASYGFRIKSVYAQNSAFPPGGDNIQIKYASLGGNYSETYYSGMSEALYCAGFAGNIHHWTISRCFLHNSTHTIVQFAGVNDMVIEYCLIGPGWGKEAIRGQINCYNTTIRYNAFYNASQRDPEDSTSGITAEIAIWSGSNFDNNAIYGNTFSNSKSGGRNGVIIVGGNGSSWVGPGANGTKVYNNTFAGVAEAAVFGEVLLNGSNNEAKNNLFYNCAGSRVSASSVSNNLTASSDPFVNYSQRDFRPTATSQARNAGIALGASYSVDPLGIVRGGDGNWDVGAFEYQSTSGSVAPTISTHPANTSVTTGESAPFFVTAAGTQPLTFRWQRNGVDIPDAPGSTYSTPPTTAADNGATFRVLVSNVAGSATSNSATLTVTPPVTGNTPPSVGLTEPANNSTYSSPANVAIAASAIDSDGNVVRVEFFNGPTKIGEDVSAPFSFAWSSVGAGTYTLTARAYDDDGASAISSAIGITVTPPTGNAPPSVNLTAPTNGAVYNAPASIALSASASDSDGNIVRVEFFNGTALIGEDVTAPYTLTWPSVGPGIYNLSARAYDDDGASANSSAVSVSVAVDPPPTTLAIGDRVTVTIEPSLRVRSTPQLAGAVLGEQAYDAVGTVIGGPIVADGFTFYQINYDTGVDGWSIRGDTANPWLSRTTAPVPPTPPTGLRILAN